MAAVLSCAAVALLSSPCTVERRRQHALLRLSSRLDKLDLLLHLLQGERTLIRKTMIAVGLASSALALGMWLASPAAATTGKSEFTVVYPDQKPRTTFWVENVGAWSGNMTGKSVVYWQVIDDQVPFTSFKITTRIEERLTRTSEDHVVTSKTCDLTEIVNDHAAWWRDDTANICVAPPVTYDGELYWSSDATVVYDLVGDGKGPITQELDGSPLIHG
ncbi:hypothetical protein ACGFNV_45405 [Streptomyces sp. NPDC048751]|uniref:hypothetical protein n=1 Tax=Streptomyces sp. NPDC048751 TaxID=3365591 RepID=UPI0037230792